MNLYRIGDKVCSSGAEGVIFDMTDAGGLLLLKFSQPTAAEKRAFKQNISVRHTVVEDIIFILCRIGTLQWCDAPYARQFSTQLTKIENINDGMGLSIHAMLIDSSTGVLVAQKIISLSTEESRTLRTSIMNQPIIKDYDQRLARVLSTYTTDQLLERITQC